MFFRKKTKKATSKIDKLVTGLIIGGAVASIVGLSKTKKGQDITKDMKNKSSSLCSKLKNFFGKTTISILEFFDKFKK